MNSRTIFICTIFMCTILIMVIVITINVYNIEYKRFEHKIEGIEIRHEGNPDRIVRILKLLKHDVEFKRPVAYKKRVELINEKMKEYK